MSFLHLLQEDYQKKTDPQGNEFITYALEGAVNMLALIDDLLNYARVTKPSGALAHTSCKTVVERVIKNLYAAITKNQAVVTCDALPSVMADPMQLSQLFQNLIGNAVKFQGERIPRVHISAQLVNDQWVFSVHDNGIGIDPSSFQRIFVIFQRLHSREKYPGTGIGLALCKKIVERHGGKIWVESQVGKGSTFYFTLNS